MSPSSDAASRSLRLVVSLLLAAGFAQAADSPPTEARNDPDTRAAVDPNLTASAVWAARCASCHGQSGRADTPSAGLYKVDDLSTQEWNANHSDAEIIGDIRLGIAKTKMRSFGAKLTEKQLAEVVKLIRSFSR